MAKKTKESAEEKCREYELLLKRLQAEFDNYRKREEKSREDGARFSCGPLALALLPYLDTLEQAMKSNREAFEPLYAQLISILKPFGIVQMEAVGKEFDAHLHDVMLKEENPDLEDGLITVEIQKGYFMHDRVLRHAKVKVNRKPEQKDDNKRDKQEGNTEAGQ